MARVHAAVAAALFVAPLAACIHIEVSGPSSARPAVAGTWVGMGVQDPEGIDGATFPMQLVINPDGDGAVAYPTFGCSGVMRRLRTRGRAVEYRETITAGADRCITGGAVTLIRSGDRLFWLWTGEGTADPEVKASAVLAPEGAAAP